MTVAVWPRNQLARAFPRGLFSWIVRDQIAAMAMPAINDLETLRRAGITLLVSAVATPFEPEAVRRVGLRHLHIPVEYWRAPSEEQTRKFITATRAELMGGGKVAVHCVGGIGRTGTLIASYLVSRGLSADKAISFVRRRRPGSIESIDQENAVYAWEAAEARQPAVLVLAPPDGDNGKPVKQVQPQSPRIVETPQSDAGLREERDATMADSVVRGYLKWGTNGADVDIRALSPTPGDAPRVEDLKAALRGFNSHDGITVTLTEVLGRDGEAWITVSCGPGRQAGLLMAAGEIVDQLVRANVYDEVLLCNP